MPCSICLESKRWYQDIRTLKCGHKFHINCIVNWTNLQLSCPECRIEILKQRPCDYSYAYSINKGNTKNFPNLNKYLQYCGIEEE